MNTNQLSIGWAVSRPCQQRESAVSRIVESLRACSRQARQWWGAESITFSRLCATERGETFTHGQAVLACIAGVAFVLVLGVASWLEGGAA